VVHGHSHGNSVQKVWVTIGDRWDNVGSEGTLWDSLCRSDVGTAWEIAWDTVEQCGEQQGILWGHCSGKHVTE
jgi:hypothetical protein